jgi:peptide chain release factor 1
MFERLEAYATRLDALDRQLMDPAIATDGRKLRQVAQEAARVREVVEAYEEHKRLQTELAGAREVLADEADPELKELARAEIADLEQKIEASAHALRLLLLPRDPYEGRPLMIEIRAGTGGDEGALFAGDLLRMYQRFAEVNGLRAEVIAGSPGNAGGFKEVVMGVTGEAAYNLLRWEGGVHKVQRVPATEAQGRVHSSTATVAVMPEPDEVEVKIDAKDLRIDTMRAGGPGGQSVNTTDSAVRVVHIPTGLAVLCQDEKSQHKNKDKALRVLKARLLEKEIAERKASETAARRSMVGSGDLAEKIRTYNFPQNRVTDHRIGLTLYRLESVVNGDLREIVDALTAAHHAELLAEQGAA